MIGWLKFLGIGNQLKHSKTIKEVSGL